ncbi:hypothetical protein FocTR4_00007968 [Fusarium oxysporum f. sp. cubense]|uniref:Major facilitator superfamily (MFS) profile domain-containing protein n=2 Tax=Fusarium oxysporum species complex TaxID=171631 RepID=A0A5C6SQ02_FUSOC|nr:hypothetical protein FocTR4_00007968 [Fusarium oxysporum f. sp. cubense]
MAIGPKLMRAIVRNDAMREDPPEIYGWRVFALVFSACFGGMLFGWETGAIGGVLAMNPLQEKFGYGQKSASEKATLDQNIVSTLQGGAFLACFLTSWLGERFGRRRCLIGTGTVTVVGVVFQACSAINGTLAVMYVGRFVSGLGVGAASSLVPLYVSECAPRAIRGGLIACYQLLLVTGIMLAFWVNYACLLHLTAPAIYILPLSFQGLPAIILIAGMCFCPESPRWCARKDDWESTKQILINLRGLPVDHEYVQEEIREIAEQLEHERQLVGGSSTKDLLRELVTIPGNRKRTFIIFMLMVWQQMTGVNAVNYYAPQIFKNLGMTGTEAFLFATGIYGILKVTGVAIFLIFMADSLGRRASLLWTSAAMAFTMFIVGIYGRIEPPIAGKPISPFGYVAIVCIYLWAAFYHSVGWLFNFVIARTVLTMQQTMGTAGYGMFFMFGCFCLSMGLFAWFFIPETKGLSLEKMDELFGSTPLTPGKSDAEMASGTADRPSSIYEVNSGKS